MEIYVERGKRRVFAGALEWPGLCRAARDEGAAIDALFAYAGRYRATLGTAARGFRSPTTAEVVERLDGNATTDFGAPSVAPSADAHPLPRAAYDRQVSLLAAAWEGFDAAAGAARGVTLRTGPRGGGRDVDAMIAHVLDADRAYLNQLGGSFRPAKDLDGAKLMKQMRDAFVEALRARARGEQPARARRSGEYWSPRYAIRRSAWHAFDHAWEIEDRSS